MATPTTKTAQAASHLVIEWMYDKHLVIYKFTDISRPTLDEWLEQAKAVFMEWDENHPFLCLMDFSSVNILTVTPYLNKKSHEATMVRPELPGRTAVLVGGVGGFFVTVIRTFIGSLQRSQGYRERRVFTSRVEAMNWLEEKLKKP